MTQSVEPLCDEKSEGVAQGDAGGPDLRLLSNLAEISSIGDTHKEGVLDAGIHT